MKKLIIILVAITVKTSCSDEINLGPISNPSASNFYKNKNEMESAVTGAYSALQTIGQYAHSYPFMMEVRSDNSYEHDKGGSGGRMFRIDVFNLNTDNRIVANAWRDSYAGIQRTNIVLARIDKVNDMDDKIKEIRKGEMKFLRALTYFNLVRFFGDVPLVLNETTNPNSSVGKGRVAKSEIYVQIIKDLTDAIASLPAKQSETGRVTKGAANALLGKVHLTLGDFAKAVTSLKAVSGYSLADNYADIFGENNENGKESIFEVQFTKGNGSSIVANGLGTGKGEGSPFPNLFAPTGGSSIIKGAQTLGNNRPTKDLFHSYSANDKRRDVSIGDFNGILYPAKLMGIVAGDLDSGINSIVLRYADVLLMLAEALNEQGYVKDGNAFKSLNQVRKRAGLADLTSADVPDQASFRLAVENERRWEFAFENHRWFDLVRTKRAVEVVNAHGKIQPVDYKFEMEKHQLLYPIPSKEIDANLDAIVQNPGY